MRIPEINAIKCPTRLIFCESKRNDLCWVQVDLILNIYYKKTMIFTLSSNQSHDILSYSEIYKFKTIDQNQLKILRFKLFFYAALSRDKH